MQKFLINYNSNAFFVMEVKVSGGKSLENDPYLSAAHLKLADGDHKVIARFLNMKYGHESIALSLHRVGFSEEKIISALNQKKLGLTYAGKNLVFIQFLICFENIFKFL